MPPRRLDELGTDEGGLVIGGGESEICKLLNAVDHDSSSALDESSLEGPGIGIGEARIALDSLGLPQCSRAIGRVKFSGEVETLLETSTQSSSPALENRAGVEAASLSE
jgi:hypothetical protein